MTIAISMAAVRAMPCSWSWNCDLRFKTPGISRMSATQIGDELVARGMDNMEVRGAL
jgi:hypothetical protein